MDVKQRLLDLAQDKIQREGIDAVSFRTLAKEVGIKSASVHYHFPKKDDLIYALTKRYLDDFSAALEQIRTTESTTIARLEGLIGLFRTSNEDDKVCYCGMMAAVSTRLERRAQVVTRSFFERTRGWVEDVIREGQEAGEFKLSLSPRSLAASIIAVLEGGLLIDHLHGSSSHLDASQELIHSLLG